MSTTFKPAKGTHTSVTSSGASLSSNAAQVGGSVIANSSNQDSGGQFVLSFAGSSSTTIGTVIACYMLPKADGSNNPSYDSSGTPPTVSPAYFVGNFYVTKASTSTQVSVLDIPIGTLKAVDYTVILVNLTGVGIASGLNLDFYGDQLTA